MHVDGQAGRAHRRQDEPADGRVVGMALRDAVRVDVGRRDLRDQRREVAGEVGGGQGRVGARAEVVVVAVARGPGRIALVGVRLTEPGRIDDRPPRGDRLEPAVGIAEEEHVRGEEVLRPRQGRAAQEAHRVDALGVAPERHARVAGRSAVGRTADGRADRVGHGGAVRRDRDVDGPAARDRALDHAGEPERLVVRVRGDHEHGARGGGACRRRRQGGRERADDGCEADDTDVRTSGEPDHPCPCPRA